MKIRHEYQYKHSSALSWEQRELEILWDLWAPCVTTHIANIFQQGCKGCNRKKSNTKWHYQWLYINNTCGTWLRLKYVITYCCFKTSRENKLADVWNYICNYTATINTIICNHTVTITTNLNDIYYIILIHNPIPVLGTLYKLCYTYSISLLLTLDTD